MPPAVLPPFPALLLMPSLPVVAWAASTPGGRVRRAVRALRKPSLPDVPVVMLPVAWQLETARLKAVLWCRRCVDAVVLPCCGATPWLTDLAVKLLWTRPWLARFPSVRLSRLTAHPLRAGMAAKTGLCPLAFPGHGLLNPCRTLAERLSPFACRTAEAGWR